MIIHHSIIPDHIKSWLELTIYVLTQETIKFSAEIISPLNQDV